MKTVAARLATLLMLTCVAGIAAAHEVRPGYLESLRGRARCVRRAVEGSGARRSQARALCASAGRVHRRDEYRLVRRRGVRLALARELSRRPHRPAHRCRWIVGDAHRRAGTRRTPGRRRADHAAHAGVAVIRGRRRPDRGRSVQDVLRARRRAHPARHRSPAVRARPAAAGRQLEAADRDRHGVHRRAQHHAWPRRRSASCTCRRRRSRR